MEPIIIAHIMGKMSGGGVESVVMNYYRNIDKNKFQFDFYIDADSKFIPKDEILRLGGRIIITPPYQKIFHYITFLIKSFKCKKYRIVHSHLNSLSIFPLFCAWVSNIPIRIAHSHSSSGKGEFIRNIIKSILKYGSNIFPTDRFACSNLSGQWLFKDRQFTIIHNAIDLDKFYYDKEKRNQIRKKYKISNQTLLIGHVGRFCTVKNHEFLLKIFKILLDTKPDSKLMLVGDGELKIHIQSLTQQFNITDKVIFIGQTNDIVAMYSAIDILVLPSLYEGLVVVGIEAQKCGLNILASDTISTETKLTENLHFLSLNAPIDFWVKSILEISKQSNDRNINPSLFKEYDIKNEVILLENKYMDMLHRESTDEAINS